MVSWQIISVFEKNINYFFTKMENKKTSLSEISGLKVSGLKVSELKSLAKQFGLNRYSKLRKQFIRYDNPSTAVLIKPSINPL